MLLGDISILIPLGVLSHTPDSVGIAYMHEAGGSSQGRHSSIPSSPITTPRSVEYSIGTLPSPTESPSRSLKTKELIPPPDGGPQPLTDTPTPCGCGKDPCSLDTGRKSSLSRPQRHPHPTGVGWSFPSDQTLRRLRSLRGFSPVVETWRHPRRPFILYEDFPNHAAIPHLRWVFSTPFRASQDPVSCGALTQRIKCPPTLVNNQLRYTKQLPESRHPSSQMIGG